MKIGIQTPPWWPLRPLKACWVNDQFHYMFMTAYLTTIPGGGPGFSLMWSGSYGLKFLVKRDSDTRADQVMINQNDFIADYGFAVWIHYVATYR